MRSDLFDSYPFPSFRFPLGSSKSATQSCQFQSFTSQVSFPIVGFFECVHLILSLQKLINILGVEEKPSPSHSLTLIFDISVDSNDSITLTFCFPSKIDLFVRTVFLAFSHLVFYCHVIRSGSFEGVSVVSQESV